MDIDNTTTDNLRAEGQRLADHIIEQIPAGEYEADILGFTIATLVGYLAAMAADR